MSMSIYKGRDENGTEVLVTTFPNGAAQVAYRPVGVRSWGPPVLLDLVEVVEVAS